MIACKQPKPLFVLLLCCLCNCVSSQLYKNADLQGSFVVAEPSIAIANGLDSIEVHVKLQGGALQQPIAQIPIVLRAGTTELVQEILPTNLQGETFAYLISKEVGTHLLDVAIGLGDKLIPVGKQIQIGFRAPSLQELPPATAGQSGSMRLNPYSAQIFPITVGFRSSDPLAQLPANYTISTWQDNFRMFVGEIVLRTAGRQSVTVYDIASDEVLEIQYFDIAPGEASVLEVVAPEQVHAGENIEADLVLKDSFGNIATTFQGAIAIESIQEPNQLPGPINLTLADLGQITVTLQRWRAQTQTIRFFSLQNASLTASITLEVQAEQVDHLIWLDTLQATACQIIAPFRIATVDRFENIVPIQGLVIQLISPNQAINGNLKQLTNNGIVVFDDVTFATLSVAEQLEVRSAGLPILLSNVFPVTIDPPQIRIDAITGQGGCVTIGYTVQQACGMPIDMYLDYRVGQGAYQHLTFSNKAGTQGIYQLPTSKMGISYQFSWDSSKDLPRFVGSDVAIRLQAKAKHIYGAATVQDGIAINNGIEFVEQSPLPMSQLLRLTTLQDMDQDGINDVVAVVDYGRDSNLLIQKRAENGNLSLLVEKALAGSIRYLSTVDLNQDAKVDLLVSEPNQISIFWGDASRTWSVQLPSIPFPGETMMMQPIAVDVNRDSFLDVVVFSTSALYVVLNNRNNTMQAPQLMVVPTVTAYAVGDSNLDGIVDLVVGFASGGIGLLLGNGLGGFTLHPDLLLDQVSVMHALQLVDSNHDGRLDIVAQHDGMAMMTLALSVQGAMVYQSEQFDLPYEPEKFVVADLDHDGEQDIWLTAPLVAPVWLPGRLGQQTARWRTMLTQPPETSAHLADSNQDGYLDLVFQRQQTFVIANNQLVTPTCSSGFEGGIVRGCSKNRASVADFNEDGTMDTLVTCDGDGNWRYFFAGDDSNYDVSFPNTIGLDDSISAPVADFNLDGHMDYLVVNLEPRLYVALGRGNGRFDVATDSNIPLGHTTYNIADLNEDGYVDLIYMNATLNQVLLYKNNQQGVFLFWKAMAVDADGRVLKIADIDLDGHMDLLMLHYNASSMATWFGDGQGGFVQRSAPLIVSSFPTDMLVEDVNNDGMLDLLLYTDVVGEIIQMHNDGLGNFRKFISYRVLTTLKGMAAADLNGDGYTDLVVSYPSVYQTEIWWGRAIAVFDQSLAVILESDGGPQFPVLADLNNDHLIDVSVHTGYGNMFIFYNLGNQEYQSITTSTAAPACHSLAVGDVNKDGHQDVVTACAGNRSIGLYLGDGRGKLERLPMQFVANNPRQLLLSDLNRDGYLDAVVRHRQPGGWSVLLYDSVKGNFLAPVFQASPSSNTLDDMRIADFNRDGWSDVVSIGLDALRMYVHFGSVGGLSNVPTTYAFTPPHYSLAVADMDQDGIQDIVLGPYTIQWRKGNSDGTFQNPITIAAGGWMQNMQVADINLDTYPDIAIFGGWTGYGTIMNQRNNTYGPLIRRNPNSDFADGAGLLVQLEQDAPYSIVQCYENDWWFSSMILRTVKPSNLFGIYNGFLTGAVTLTSGGLAIADMNEDGANDLVSISGLVSAQSSKIVISNQFR